MEVGYGKRKQKTWLFDVNFAVSVFQLYINTVLLTQKCSFIDTMLVYRVPINLLLLMQNPATVCGNCTSSTCNFEI